MHTLLLLLTLLFSGTAVRDGHTVTVVLHVEVATPSALHLEVLGHDGVVPMFTEISSGTCLAHGCNAVGTSATMTETLRLDSTEAITLTGYVSSSDGSAQTIAIPVPAWHAVLFPMVTDA